MIEVQRSAAHIVGHVLAGRSLDAELQNLFSSARALSAHDRATLQDAAFGTLRFLGEIDTVLDDLLKRPLESDRLRNLLRIALYQLIHTRAAPHAVVDHAVRSASALGEARFTAAESAGYRLSYAEAMADVRAWLQIP